MATIIITSTIVSVLFTSAVSPLPDSERSLAIANSEFYCPLLNFEKHSLCYDSLPEVIGVSDSCAGCALECFTLKTCIFFQWIVSSKECHLFFREPQNNLIVEKEFCSSYALAGKIMTVLRTTPIVKSACEIPFTFKGVLYYDCVTILKDKKCSLYACQNTQGKIKYCLQDGLVVRNATMVLNVTCPTCPYFLLPPAPFVNNFIVIFSRNFSTSSFNWSSSLEKMNNFSADSQGNYWYGLLNMEKLSLGPPLRLRIEVQLAFPSNVWISESYSWMRVLNSKLNIGPLLYSDAGVPSQLTRFNGSDFTCGCGQTDSSLSSCWWHKCNTTLGVLTGNGSIWMYNSTLNVPLQWARMMVKL